MAQLVVAAATSHSPQLSAPPETWAAFGDRDRANASLVCADGLVRTYRELERLGPRVDPEDLTPLSWKAKHVRAQVAIATLGDVVADAAPDAVIIVGDDQEELFLDDGTPMFAVYAGAQIDDIPPTEDQLQRVPPDVRAGLWAFHADERESYSVHVELATTLAEALVSEEFDIAYLGRQPEDRTLGHAFTFVRRRILRNPVPVVPLTINTYYPPNRPSPNRCLALGAAIRRAIDAWDSSARVAVVASGGLSHFVVDEPFDRRVLAALQTHDIAALSKLPTTVLRSGTSEVLNWLVVGAAAHGLAMEVVDYIPAFRTEAGTGVGMAFAHWRVSPT